MAVVMGMLIALSDHPTSSISHLPAEKAQQIKQVNSNPDKRMIP